MCVLCNRAYSEPEPLTPSEETRHVVVELRPLSVTSWLYVQGLAQNPRVRYVLICVGAHQGMKTV